MENTPQYQLDTLKAYVKGQLDQELSKEISQEAMQSEVLATMIEGLRFALEESGIDDVDAYLEKTHQKQHTLITDHFRKERPAKQVPRYAIAAAVSVLCLAGLWLLTLQLSYPDPGALAAAQLEQPYALRNLSKRGTVTEEAVGGTWQSAYQNGQYEKTVRLLSQPLQLSEEERFYKALSHLYLSQTEQAIPLLEQVMAMDNTHGYAENARWYLVLAYIQDGKRTQASTLLKTITERTRHYKKKEAEKLLKVLS